MDIQIAIYLLMHDHQRLSCTDRQLKTSLLTLPYSREFRAASTLTVLVGYCMTVIYMLTYKDIYYHAFTSRIYIYIIDTNCQRGNVSHCSVKCKKLTFLESTFYQQDSAHLTLSVQGSQYSISTGTQGCTRIYVQ